MKLNLCKFLRGPREVLYKLDKGFIPVFCLSYFQLHYGSRKLINPHRKQREHNGFWNIPLPQEWRRKSI